MSAPWPYLFRKQSGRTRVWDWVTTSNLRYTLPLLPAGSGINHYEFSCGNKFLGTLKELRDDTGWELIIRAGYAFNGITRLRDFKRALPAIVLHDFLYQMLQTPHLTPWTRKDADAALLRVARNHGFRLAGLYYAVVRPLGVLKLRKSLPTPSVLRARFKPGL